MSDRTKTKKITILLVIIAVVLAAAFILSFVLTGDGAVEEIALPSATPVQTQQPEAQQPQEESVLSIGPENVKDVLSKTITRPSSYHRSLSISIVSGENVSQSAAEIWVRGNSEYIEIQDASQLRHILISDSKVSIWYDGDEAIHSFTESDMFSIDDLLGIPTYEDILDVDVERIISADYVVDSTGSPGTIYVEFLSEDGEYSHRYWISIETGLLTEATVLYGGSADPQGGEYSGGEVVYSMAETTMELLPASDSEFTDRFTAPEA